MGGRGGVGQGRVGVEVNVKGYWRHGVGLPVIPGPLDQVWRSFRHSTRV